MTTDGMNIERMEELLRRFFEGETTRSEDRELYVFFCGAEVPAHLAEYIPVFRYMEQELPGEIPVDDTFLPPVQTFVGRRLWLTVAVAASAGLLLLAKLFWTEPFYPYEGSYMVRNGVRIENPELIRAEQQAIDAELHRKRQEMMAVDRAVTDRSGEYEELIKNNKQYEGN